MRRKFPVSTKGGTVEQWINVARDVLRGKYLKSDRSTKDSLYIGLKATKSPECVKALAVLDKKK